MFKRFLRKWLLWILKEDHETHIIYVNVDGKMRKESVNLRLKN